MAVGRDDCHAPMPMSPMDFPTIAESAILSPLPGLLVTLPDVTHGLRRGLGSVAAAAAEEGYSPPAWSEKVVPQLPGSGPGRWTSSLLRWCAGQSRGEVSRGYHRYFAGGKTARVAGHDRVHTSLCSGRDLQIVFEIRSRECLRR